MKKINHILVIFIISFLYATSLIASSETPPDKIKTEEAIALEGKITYLKKKGLRAPFVGWLWDSTAMSKNTQAIMDLELKLTKQEELLELCKNDSSYAEKLRLKLDDKHKIEIKLKDNEIAKQEIDKQILNKRIHAKDALIESLQKEKTLIMIVSGVAVGLLSIGLTTTIIIGAF